jgi:hypothetical protein
MLCCTMIRCDSSYLKAVFYFACTEMAQELISALEHIVQVSEDVKAKLTGDFHLLVLKMGHTHPLLAVKLPNDQWNVKKFQLAIYTNRS